MKSYLLPLALVMAVSPWAQADVVVSLGNTSPGFTNGQHPIGGATILAAQSGQPAPFNGACGNDTQAGGVGNCSTSWTFNYSVSGQVITGATISFGIYDIDSAATGNQVASFKLTGGDDMTVLLNLASEGVNGGTGSVNSEYDVLSVTIPATSFLFLDGSSSATFSLALQAPGLGVIGNSPSNGASLLYSTLDLQTEPITNTPEPSLLPFLIGGIGAIVVARRFRKQTQASDATQSI